MSASNYTTIVAGDYTYAMIEVLLDGTYEVTFRVITGGLISIVVGSMYEALIIVERNGRKMLGT